MKTIPNTEQFMERPFFQNYSEYGIVLQNSNMVRVPIAE